MTRTAAAMLIGNEILSGKIQESNLALLAKELRRLGVQLRRVIICPDDVVTIAADLIQLSRDHDYVITSGGVGPTHDDVTMKAVAAAFETTVVRNPMLEAKIKELVGDRVNAGHLRMADVPDGAKLVQATEFDWPTVLMDNVYVLPGLPGIFRAKLPMLRQHIGASRPFLSRAVYTTQRETDIATILDALEKAHELVDIGSYPVLDRKYRVRITFDGKDQLAIDRALDAFVEQLPPESIYDPTDEDLENGGSGI